jgi:hypothetical protein
VGVGGYFGPFLRLSTTILSERKTMDATTVEIARIDHRKPPTRCLCGLRAEYGKKCSECHEQAIRRELRDNYYFSNRPYWETKKIQDVLFGEE